MGIDINRKRITPLEYLAYTDHPRPRIEEIVPVKRERLHRNDLCPCGSGVKYKKCCGSPKDLDKR